MCVWLPAMAYVQSVPMATILKSVSWKDSQKMSQRWWWLEMVTIGISVCSRGIDLSHQTEDGIYTPQKVS